MIIQQKQAYPNMIFTETDAALTGLFFCKKRSLKTQFAPPHHRRGGANHMLLTDRLTTAGAVPSDRAPAVLTVKHFSYRTTLQHSKSLSI